MWPLQLLSDDQWDVIVPIRHSDRYITRMESDDILISFWFRMEPCCVEKDSLWLQLFLLQANMGGNPQSRLQHQIVGNCAMKIFLRL